MNNATALMLCLFFMFGILVPSANAVRLYKKGYEVDIAWKEKTKGDNIYLVIWGDMHGGALHAIYWLILFNSRTSPLVRLQNPRVLLKDTIQMEEIISKRNHT